MLSSSPSPLLSSLSPLTVAGGDAAPGTDAAPGFAELLNGLANKAPGAVSDAKDAEQTGAEARSPAKGKVLAARAGRLAIAAKAGAAEGKDGLLAVALPATATDAASESGKILPVALPEAAAAGAGADTDAVVAANPFPLPVLPGALSTQAGTTEPGPTTAIASRRPVAATAQALARKVNPAAGQQADKAMPEAQAGEPRPAQSVAITVAAPVQAPAAVTAEAGARPATPVRSKAARAADLARIEAPLPQVSAPAAAVAQFTQVGQTAQPANAAAPALPAMPSPNDIDAALDHLVAAREALMPAEAALAIDHADFGEISIKFEQSSDGRLSAELSAADPELQRAVTAAAATDRGTAANAEGDSGRSAQLANHRGSATAGSDASGGRSQSSSGQSNAERDMPQRRAPTRSQGGQAATDQRPGVFA
jgi:hypothetical protein